MPPHAKHTMSHHQPGPLGGRKLGSEKQTAPYSVGSIIAQSARKAQRSASSSIPGHASALIVLHGTDHLHGASPISGYGSPPGSDHGSSYSAQSAAAAEQQPASPPAADSSSPGSRRSSVAYCRNVVFADFDAIPNGRERASAVVRRLILHHERGLSFPLFAWGRMTLTIKSDTVLMGPPLELWKPKRHEIVAVLAYLWMGRNRGLMAELGFPGFELDFEDDTVAGSGVQTLIRGPVQDFPLLQREISTHWGVHKRTLCPVARPVAHNQQQRSAPAAPTQAHSPSPALSAYNHGSSSGNVSSSGAPVSHSPHGMYGAAGTPHSELMSPRGYSSAPAQQQHQQQHYPGYGSAHPYAHSLPRLPGHYNHHHHPYHHHQQHRSGAGSPTYSHSATNTASSSPVLSSTSSMGARRRSWDSGVPATAAPSVRAQHHPYWYAQQRHSSMDAPPAHYRPDEASSHLGSSARTPAYHSEDEASDYAGTSCADTPLASPNPGLQQRAPMAAAYASDDEMPMHVLADAAVQASLELNSP